MRFSDILRALAEEKGLTQKKIAADLGIPASTIGGYFQGTSEPDLETVKSIAKYFNCSVDMLIGHTFEHTLSLQEELLLHLYRCMTGQQRTLFMELGKTVIRNYPET